MTTESMILIYRVIKPNGFPFLIDGLGYKDSEETIHITGLRAVILNEDDTVGDYIEEFHGIPEFLQYCKSVIIDAVSKAHPCQSDLADEPPPTQS
jgi:hypothetical protein